MDFLNQCRICLEIDKEKYFPISVKYENESLAELINFCTQVQVDLNDSYPKTVCQQCFEDLKTAYHLKMRCIQSEEKLKEVTIKEEEFYDEGEQTVTSENFASFLINESLDNTNSNHAQYFKNEEITIESIPVKDEKTKKSKRKVTKKAKRNSTEKSNQFEFSCILCKSSFNTKSNLHYHIQEHKKKGDAPLDECSNCQKKFYLPDSYLKHKCAVKPICHICKIEFNLRAEVYKHIEEFHMVNGVFTCEQPSCRSVLTSVNSVFFHNLSHFNPIIEICSSCGKVFKDPSTYAKHIRFHKQRIQYTCDMCGIKIWRRQNLFRHMKTCHLHKKRFCDECGASFSEIMSLKLHKIKVHGMEAPFKCDECNVGGFVYQSQLNLHKKGHLTGKHFRVKETNEIVLEGKRAWECSTCSKTFSMKANYKRHMQTVHLQIRQYSCDECDKKFTQKSVLDTHARIHTGEKPFSCNHCPAKYSDRSTLWKHLKNIHKEKKPATKVSQSQSLNLHPM